jgi:hypothetical protein
MIIPCTNRISPAWPAGSRQRSGSYNGKMKTAILSACSVTRTDRGTPASDWNPSCASRDVKTAFQAKMGIRSQKQLRSCSLGIDSPQAA